MTTNREKIQKFFDAITAGKSPDEGTAVLKDIIREYWFFSKSLGDGPFSTDQRQRLLEKIGGDLGIAPPQLVEEKDDPQPWDESYVSEPIVLGGNNFQAIGIPSLPPISPVCVPLVPQPPKKKSPRRSRKKKKSS